MTISQLIHLAENRIVHLTGMLAEANRIGDVDQVSRLQNDLDQTNATLSALRTLA
jgi:hypothetical protein